MSQPKTIALTGASGFVGKQILKQLLEANFQVRLLTRDHTPTEPQGPASSVITVQGNILCDNALRQLVQGADAVIHLVGIIMENNAQGQTFYDIHTLGTEKAILAAKNAGIKRFIHMSALGTRPDAKSRYHQSKWRAEQSLRQSQLDWTLFRPSVIHGPQGQMMQMIRDFWCNLMPPFVPYFSKRPTLGDFLQLKTALLCPWRLGRPYPNENKTKPYISHSPAGLLQPVWVQDVARCFVSSVTNQHTLGQTYNLGGPDRFTWPGFYKACQHHLPQSRHKIIAPLPAWYAKLLANLPSMPFNKDQVIMSQEDSICDIGKVEHDFNFKLSPFEATFAKYAKQIM